MGSAPARLARLEDAARAAWLAGCDGWGLYWHVALADGGFLADPGAAARARVEGSGAPELEVPATDTPPTQAEVDALFAGHLLQYYAGARALFGIPGADHALQHRLRELLGVPDRTLQGMLDAALAIGRRHGLVDDEARSDRETTMRNLERRLTRLEWREAARLEGWRAGLLDWYRGRSAWPVADATEIPGALLAACAHFRATGRIGPPPFPEHLHEAQATLEQRESARRYAGQVAAVLRPWLYGTEGADGHRG